MRGSSATNPRALKLEEFPALLDDFARASGNAMAAGFDGVHIHAANGYLIDQFLRNSSNHRDDDYGGSIENRIRLLREVTRTVAGVAGADRTSVRLSPNGDAQGVNDTDPVPLFTAAAEMLDGIGIAFLELRELILGGSLGGAELPPIAPAIRNVFQRPLVLNSDYTSARAEAAVAGGEADAISFGRAYISNPDLADRIARGAPLTPDDQTTWYTQSAKGYIDYPAA